MREKIIIFMNAEYFSRLQPLETMQFRAAEDVIYNSLIVGVTIPSWIADNVNQTVIADMLRMRGQGERMWWCMAPTGKRRDSQQSKINPIIDADNIGDCKCKGIGVIDLFQVINTGCDA